MFIMGQELATAVEMETPEYGPKMLALTPLQRRLVEVYLDHPTWTVTAIAEEAGYAKSCAAVRGSVNMRDNRVIAAINEEGDRRFKTGGPLAITALLTMVMNPQHKDHFRACVAVADRTGYHALSEHKVTVDDKRPQSKAELIAAVKNVAAELGMSPKEIEKLTGEKIIDGEFTTIDPEVDAQIAREMEDL